MKPSENIDRLIAANPDWRGATLAHARRLILDVDPRVVERWKCESTRSAYTPCSRARAP